jgi:hypothetical protein
MRVIQKVNTASTHVLLPHFPWDFSSILPTVQTLLPSDFHLLTHFKQFLGGTCMGNDEEVKMMVKDWFSGLATDFHNAVIQKLIT